MQTVTMVGAKYARWSKEFNNVSSAMMRAQRRLADPRTPEQQRIRLQQRVIAHETILDRLQNRMYGTAILA